MIKTTIWHLAKQELIMMQFKLAGKKQKERSL